MTDQRRLLTYICLCFTVQVSDLQDALEEVHRKTLQNVPLNALQKDTYIPFETFSAPLEMKEDLSFKRKTFQSKTTEKKFEDVTSASYLFQIEGKCAQKVYLLGEPGRGKTGQCYQLLQHWVQAREVERERKDLSPWQKCLAAYDLVFLITLRHVQNERKSVLEMICKNVLKEYPQFHDKVRKILESGFQSAKCLVIIDGLDEMKGEPDIDVDISRCTIFLTSRHWKFHCDVHHIGDRDKVLEIRGLSKDGVKQVIQKILENYPESTTSFDEMNARTQKPNLKSIMQIPLLLTLSVHLWQTNEFTEASMTSFYALLLNFLLKSAFIHKRVTNNPLSNTTGVNVIISFFTWMLKYLWMVLFGSSLQQSETRLPPLPLILSKKESIKSNLNLMLSLGKLGYRDLVLGDLDQSSKGRETSQLIFEKDILESEKVLGKELLTFALNVGLLSQSSAPGAGDEENVSINFFHKTVEEFLAALYLVCSDEVSLDSFLESCSSIEKIMELSNILIFSVGLEPSMGIAVSEHIALIAGSDTDVISSRQGFGNENETMKLDMMAFENWPDQKVKRMFKTLCDCKQEMKYTLTQSETTQISKFIISDVYVDMFTDDSTVAISTEILSQDNGSIVSLHFEYGRLGKNAIPFQNVKEFLDNTSSLQTLHISKDGLFGSYGLGLYREDRPTLCSIAPIFLSLTFISLADITLTSDAAGLLQNAIQTNEEIQALQLYSLWRADDVTEVILDMKANTKLRTLSLQQLFDPESLNILLVDIKQCTSLNSLSLVHVHVQSVDMLQAALLSFKQLKGLTLDRVTFSNDNKDKMYLDLAACTDLTDLNLTEIHVDSIKISPDSLQKLRISVVSGSLRGLLSILPECQHLTDLSITSLSDEQDVKLLADVLPPLTQVRDMTYRVGRQLDKENEGVVRFRSSVSQAMTKMTGLERLTIFDIDMGDMALTLTPLMTHIKLARFPLVEMTASNWGKFIASLREIQHEFDIELEDTNIDDKSASTVHTSPHFKVTLDYKGEKKGVYPCLVFSKLSS